MVISWHTSQCVLKHREEPVTNVVAALVNNGHWNKGKLRLSGALGGTSLAAVAYHQGEEQIRLYYQAADLSLKEHCHNAKGWHPGRSISPVRFHSPNPNRNFAKAHSTPEKRRLEPPSVLSTSVYSQADHLSSTSPPLKSCIFKSTGTISMALRSSARTPEIGALPRSFRLLGVATSFP